MLQLHEVKEPDRVQPDKVTLNKKSASYNSTIYCTKNYNKSSLHRRDENKLNDSENTVSWEKEFHKFKYLILKNF